MYTVDIARTYGFCLKYFYMVFILKIGSRRETYFHKLIVIWHYIIYNLLDV
jgi:hypothetical protein